MSARCATCIERPQSAGAGGAPAVIPQSGSQGSPRGRSSLSPGNFQIGRGRQTRATYLDGAPLNLTYVNLIALVPTQDAVSDSRSRPTAFPRSSGARRAGSSIWPLAPEVTIPRHDV